jgi:hypothetical protein
MDLSREGLAITATDVYHSGALLRVQITVRGDKNILLCCEVRWVENRSAQDGSVESVMGLRIAEITQNREAYESWF